jgi:hypothetical protein
VTPFPGPRIARRSLTAFALTAALAPLGFAVSARAQDPAAPVDTTAAPAAPVVVPQTAPAPVPDPAATTAVPPAPTTTAVVPPPAPVTTTAEVTPPVPAAPPIHQVTPSAKPKHHADTTSTSTTPAPPATAKKSHHHAKKTAADTAPAPFTAPATAISSLLLDSFRIPPFLLPIYQAAGIQYGIHWQVLAAINEIESDYGRNLNVSSAGAVGWMQFEPATWARYGVDANGDGKRDPYNPVDAIFAAARYLKAAGGDTYVRQSIYAYNHAGWYVNSVLLRARLISALPDSLVSALTGLTQGRPPVPGSRYAVQLLSPKIGVDVVAPPGTAAVAVQDGRVTRIGYSKRLGHFVQLVDVYGNTYTYGHLGTIADFYPVPKPQTVTAGEVAKELHLSGLDATPDDATSANPALLHDVHHSARVSANPVLNVTAASETTKKPHVVLAGDLHIQTDGETSSTPAVSLQGDPGSTQAIAAATPVSDTPHVALPAATTPTTPAAPPAATTVVPHVTLASDSGDVVTAVPPVPLKDASLVAGVHALPGDGTIGAPILIGYDVKDRAAGAKLLGLKQSQITYRPLREGSSVVGGTVLGRLGGRSLRFEVRPAGTNEPRIDPAPLISGWRQLQRTAIFSSPATARLAGLGSDSTTVGQVLLMTKRELMARVLVDPRITIYECGRRDIETGQIDRRVLAVLEYLADSNLDPTISALKCGHSILTDSGNISEHSTGDAVDVAAINGIPIVGHQGPGTITDTTIRRLLQLQGVMKPHQIISLMTFPGADNTLALPDHYDHIHIGYHPAPGTAIPGDGSDNATIGDATPSQLTPSQWQRLMTRLAQIGNPQVPTTTSSYALPDD